MHLHSTLRFLALGLALASPGWAADPGPAANAQGREKERAAPVVGGNAKLIGDQVRAALQSSDVTRKQLPVVVKGKDNQLVTEPVTVRPRAVRQPAKAADAATQQQYHRAYTKANGQRPRELLAAAHEHDIHWAYEGKGGPANWSRLNPEYRTCASGKRQSPIHIEDSYTLQGPAEAIQFDYRPSNGTVVNNGHTVQVNVEGDNTITVRGSTFKLLQFHFHHPAEERINNRGFAMVAHLVHRSEQGQLAVVAVLLDPGSVNRLIHKVWTYMPLDTDDSVRMPPGMVDLSELLPPDQRYYQFMGSLTTPPCTEGVLWLVLKQPVAIGPEQLRLFGQLFPNNARPVQPVNGRPVREAQ